MFDIGFTEVTLIAVIGLLVIGPERLPRVARDIGLWVGRLRRYVAQIRADIEREVRADELRELVNKPAQELKAAIKDTEKTIKETEKTIQEEEKKLEKDLNAGAGKAADTVASSSAGAASKREESASSPASTAAPTLASKASGRASGESAAPPGPGDAKREGDGGKTSAPARTRDGGEEAASASGIEKTDSAAREAS